MAIIDFSTAAATPLSATPPHRVYTRAAWADLWTLRADIHCVQCVWSAAPHPSTATLLRHYGRVVLPGGTASADYLALDLAGQFVLLEWDTDEAGIAVWLGIIDSTANAPDGTTDGTVPAAGTQAYAAFGLERLLQVSPILDTVWKDAATTYRGGSATEFNADGWPNRSSAPIGGAYVFDPAGSDYWSTRDIIGHLLTYHLPTNSGGVTAIPWSLVAPALAPDWDRPRIETEGQTIYNILTRLLTPRLLLGWGVGFSGSGLQVVPFSLASADIALGGKTFPANTAQHTISAAADPLTDTEISSDNLDVVDQVVVRGARRVSVCTLEIASGLENAWIAFDEAAYNAGASAEASYATMDQYQQRQANERIRRAMSLRSVWCRVRIPSDWDYTTLGSEDAFATDDPGTPHRPYLTALRLLDELPLRYGVDYSGTLAGIDTTKAAGYRPPLITMTHPDYPAERIDVSMLGDSFDMLMPSGIPITWSIATRVDPEERSISLSVSGAPQHVLGGSDFVPLPVDSDVYGAFSIATIAATVAIAEDRCCQAISPATVPTADVVRRRVIHVGDAYQQVYIVPGTVVAIDYQGSENTSDGGYLRDDTAQLEYLAGLFAAYHTSPRRSLVLRTTRRTGLATVGSMVASADGVTIGAVITRIQIDAPLGDGRRPADARQTIIATATRLDLLATLQTALSP